MGTLIHTRDERLWRCVAKEVNKLAGMFCRYFILCSSSSQIDPLYNEFDLERYNIGREKKEIEEGIRLPVFTSFAERTVSASEEGRRVVWDAQLWVAKCDWEQIIGEDVFPKIGDVVMAWGKFYDVIFDAVEGVMDDERTKHTIWRLDLRRNDKYDAKRRIE